ncbi:MAG: tyrosine-type recombinase/integrase [Rubrivivax sp.]|nr:tyrosine-type recombinase/integrase [Rubrivivax sp.]
MYAIESIHRFRQRGFAPAISRRSYLPMRVAVERRYAANTVRMYVYGVAHFARWMRRCRVDVRDLADEVVQRFIDEHLPRCSCPSPVQRCRHQVRAALRQLLITLVDAGVLVSSRQPDAIEDQLAHFDAHMRQAMGLAETTRVRRLSVVRSLLQFRLTGDAGSDATTLPSSDELRRFIAQELSRVSPASASLLRVRCAATCASWRSAGPVWIICCPSSRRQPIGGWRRCRRRCPRARSRDCWTPSRRGCRRTCVATPWCAAWSIWVCANAKSSAWNSTISTGRPARCASARGKSRRVDVMPLPQTTGHAIAAYLRSERPTTVNRCVFVRHVAPLDEPIRSDVVRNTVRLAYLRCGLPFTRVHILRHTLARRLLETGGTLKDVADMLRHRALDTSMIYAKVDIGRLAAVAMPWPGSAA